MLSTIIGVDLAKKVFQVCVYTNKKVRSNTNNFIRPPMQNTPAKYNCNILTFKNYNGCPCNYDDFNVSGL